MVARVSVAVVAVVAIAWLGVMERDARVEAHGVRIAGRLTSPAEARRAVAAFDDAKLLNPDTAPELERAFVYQATGRLASAAAVLEDVLRREPDNLTAWGVLYAVTRDRDPEAAQRALAARRRLDPVNARRR